MYWENISYLDKQDKGNNEHVNKIDTALNKNVENRKELNTIFSNTLK